MPPQRTPLTLCDPRIRSAYRVGGGVGTAVDNLVPFQRAGGYLCRDAGEALARLDEAVAGRGGALLLSDGYRSIDEQARARARYDRWLADGKPRPPDPDKHKAVYVGRPGRSFHTAGRAVDVHLAALALPGVPADRQLDVLWELARPLGWRPVIARPTEGADESWHFDFPGPWLGTVERLGYEWGALAAVLDVGGDPFPTDPPARTTWRWVQAQLHRFGVDVGDLDGQIGPRTRAGLAAAGYRGDEADADAVIAHVAALPNGGGAQ